jgi:arginyl-tRNA synthetase
MYKIKALIESLLANAVNELLQQEGLHVEHPFDISIERPRDPSHGDYSSNIAMLLTKVAKMPPRLLAEQLLKQIPSHPFIEASHVAGPGFINFRLSQHYLSDCLENLWTSPHCGINTIQDNITVVVDYSSPNLAKEMHVGHLRSTIIGDALSRVLEQKAYRVIRQNHVGDWGTQFGMLIAHLDDEKQAHAGKVELNDLESFYKRAKQRFDADPHFAERARQWVVLLQSGDPHCKTLWTMFIELSLAHCQAIYQRLGVDLQESDVRAESAYNEVLPEIVQRLQKQGLLVEHDGAQCAFLDEFKGKNDEPLPVIVQKSDGGFLYASTDLAAIDYRHQHLHAARVLYVVDARQALHFQQIFALARKASFASADMQLEHINFGMVLDKSGKPYKSRDGGVTKLADLLDEAVKRAKALITSKTSSAQYPPNELEHMANVLGISAIKYADLSKNRISDYIFDWDSMISFEGNTAPYLLYAYTRINSLFQKAACEPAALNDPIQLTNSHENDLAKQLLLYPEVIDNVAEKAMPHLLCTYLYELAVHFSSFYEACPILNQEQATVRQSRLKLAALTARVLKQGLGLLGIATLKRM